MMTTNMRVYLRRWLPWIEKRLRWLGRRRIWTGVPMTLPKNRKILSRTLRQPRLASRRVSFTHRLFITRFMYVEMFMGVHK